MSFKIQLRRDTKINWSTINPVLLESEFGYETDTKRAKIGDGTNVWNNLPYWPDSNKLDLYGPTGGFQTGATGMGITGGGITTEIIGGIPYYIIEKSDTRSYCIRFEYDEANQLPAIPTTPIPNPVTILSNGWTSTGITINTINSPRPTASFNFVNEQTPPKNIFGYFYNAIVDKYKITTFGLGSMDYMKTANLGSNKTLPVVTNDFFSNFSNGNSNGHEIEIDMTPSGYGAQRSGSNNTHAYIIFTF